MRLSENTLTLVLLLFLFIFTAPSTAEIKSIKIRSDHRPMIHFQKFRITDIGYIKVTVSLLGVSYYGKSPRDDFSRQGFFLLSDESLIEVLLESQHNHDLCILDSKFVSLLFTFRDLSTQWSFDHSYRRSQPGEYSLFFANCNAGSGVSMDVHTELLNTSKAAESHGHRFKGVPLLNAGNTYTQKRPNRLNRFEGAKEN